VAGVGAIRKESAMMQFKSLGATILVGAMLTTVYACQKQEGPAERAGKSVDQAVDTAGKNMEKAGDKIHDAAQGERK
jgi:hypothetical protein